MSSLNEAHLLEMFLECLIAERGLSKNSVASYLSDLTHFFMHFNPRGISILTLTTPQLSEYFYSANFQTYKATTLARKISALRQLYSFLLSEKLVMENPAYDLDRPKMEERLPKALSREEIDALIQCAAAETSQDGIRTYCILEILYSTGMRVSEVLSLTLDAIQNPVEKAEEHWVIIVSGKGNKERMVILNSKALGAIDTYLKIRKLFTKNERNTFLFPSRDSSAKPKAMSRQAFFIALKKLAVLVGIDPHKVSPHKVRHSFASHILQNGANLRIVQELLGHSDISSTQIYTKVLSSQARDLVLNKHPLSTVDDI